MVAVQEGGINGLPDQFFFWGQKVYIAAEGLADLAW
jgi:hypothetical protein